MKILNIKIQGQTAVWENPFRIVSGSQKYFYIKPVFDSSWDGLDIKFLFRDRNGNEIWNSETNTAENEGTEGLVRIPAGAMTAPYFLVGVLGYGAEDKFIPTAGIKIDVYDDGYDAFSKINGISQEGKESLEELVLSDFKAVMDSYAETMTGYGESMTAYAEAETARNGEEITRAANEKARTAAEAERQKNETARCEAETVRIIREEVRNENEIARIEAEIEREEAWRVLSKTVQTAADNADTAREAAEDAAAQVQKIGNGVSNAVKGTAQGQGAVVITDISPIKHTLSVKQSLFNNYITVCGQNIWDEEWYYDEGDAYISSKNYIHVMGGIDYYLHCSSQVNEEYIELFYITFYDIDTNRISFTWATRNSVITTPSGCAFIKFHLTNMYGRVYANDICINVSDERINGTYVPYQGMREYVFNSAEKIAQIESFYPVTTLVSDGAYVTIECEYNRDVNVALEDSYTREQADARFQEKLTDEQLANLEKVPDKADKTVVEGIMNQLAGLEDLLGGI